MSQVLFVGVAQLLVLLGANGQGAPPGLPPLAEDPVLAAAAPPQCLAYLTWSGSRCAGREEHQSDGATAGGTCRTETDRGGRRDDP